MPVLHIDNWHIVLGRLCMTSTQSAEEWVTPDLSVCAMRYVKTKTSKNDKYKQNKLSHPHYHYEPQVFQAFSLPSADWCCEWYETLLRSEDWAAGDGGRGHLGVWDCAWGRQHDQIRGHHGVQAEIREHTGSRPRNQPLEQHYICISMGYYNTIYH